MPPLLAKRPLSEAFLWFAPLLACAPALETPPVLPDAGAAADADTRLDARALPASPEGGSGAAREGGAAECSEGDARDCACPAAPDGGAATGVQICSGGAYAPCRCAPAVPGLDGAVDGSPGVADCLADGFAGSLTGALQVDGFRRALRAPPSLPALTLTLAPGDTEGRRAVRGSFRATVEGAGELTGELLGSVSCAGSPPALSAQASAQLQRAAGTNALVGEFTADFIGGRVSDGAWYLASPGATPPPVQGEGRWSVSPP